MDRAVVLIGVRKTGNLPELQAVNSRVHALAGWAREQGISEDRIRLLTDETGEVRVHHISDAIEQLVGLSTIEQLIIYFAGHGVNNRGEYWLLSRAPGNPNEAVNVEGSLLLARYCGIPHVVCIADACRTAAEGIQAQHVKGGEIFPSETAAGEFPVDAFFACARGKPALEVRDPNVAAGEFSALYTDELIACLSGERADVIEYEREAGTEFGVARAWKLADHLRDAVPLLLKAKLGRAPRLNQTPVARITSRNAWLARFPGSRRPRHLRSGVTDAPVATKPLVTPFTVSERLLTAALHSDLQRWKDALAGPDTGGDPWGSDAGDETLLLRALARERATRFGPMHFETKCGFKLLGMKVRSAHCNEAAVAILDAEGTIIRVGPMRRPACNVLLELEDGKGVLVPAIAEFIAELSFDPWGEALVDVAYEPASESWRWGDYVERRDELRALRASISASVALGVLRLTDADALTLARRMQLAKGVDPTMALYVAYAYHDLQRRDLIKEMQTFLRDDLQLAFFDVAMLSREPGALTPAAHAMVPPFPMLAQGWSLLSAFRVRLPGTLESLHQHLLPSLWTMFEATGVELLKAAIASGEIRR